MEAGKPVICISALNHRDNQIAIGCEEGKFNVLDVNENNSIYYFQHSDDIILVEQIDENTIYASTENTIYFHDLRITPKENPIFSVDSEITDISANGNLLAIAKIDETITLKDQRSFKKGKTHPILPSVPNSIKFINRDKLAAGYIDTSIGFWELSKKKFNFFKSPTSNGVANPPVVHNLDVFQDFIAAARQNGLAIFKNGKLIVDNTFFHEGAVETVTFAPCFGHPVTISGANDGSLMAFDLDKMKPIDCLTVDSEKIEDVSANSKFIAVADTSENGNIAIFTPEDFQSEEEEKSIEKTNVSTIE